MVIGLSLAFIRTLSCYIARMLLATTTPITMLERVRIVEFLAGLNFEYDQVRIQILGEKKLRLKKVFSMIRSEKTTVAVFDESNRISNDI